MNNEQRVTKPHQINVHRSVIQTNLQQYRPRPLDDAVAPHALGGRLQQEGVVRLFKGIDIHRPLLQHRREHLGRS